MEQLSPPQERALARLNAQLPKGIAFVGNTEQRYFDFLRTHPDSLSQGVHPKAPGVLKALLAPGIEAASVRDAHQPLLFGAQQLLPVVQQGSGGKQLKLNLGMSASEPYAPGFPAYLELGLQRLEELKKAGAKARLRLFSTASLAPELSGSDPEVIRRSQAVQKKISEAYVRAYHPELREQVDFEDLTQEIPFLEAKELEERVREIRARVHPSILEALENCGENHGGQVGKENALAYAAYHCVPETFGDESPEEPLMSVGGPGEALFNEVRFAIAKPKASVGLVVPSGLISRTPPYLPMPHRVDLEEFMNGDSPRVQAFLENPRANRHLLELPGSRDLLHVARCTHGPKEAQLQEGLRSLQGFYASIF